MPHALTSRRRYFACALPGCTLIVMGCGGSDSDTVSQGELTFEPDRPMLTTLDPPPPYTGDNAFVLEAASRLRTGLDLQRGVLVRTCGPTGGVCHNQKEYPDLHTPSNFLNTVGSRCNIQPATVEGVFDGCEPVGDRFQLDSDSRNIEIGYVDYIVGDFPNTDDDNVRLGESTPGLHIYLHDAVEIGDQNQRYGDGLFIRTFVNATGEVDELNFASYNANWHLLDSGRHLLAEVQEYQAERVSELLSVGILQGDMNRNGLYGAREEAPLNLLEPGQPERSYLVGRLRGILGDRPIPGTRMPLANEPLSIADFLGLYCFIEGLPTDPAAIASYDLSQAIDYQGCSYSSDPEGLNLLGNGVTWLGRVKPLLESNCGGCHGGAAPQGALDMLSAGAYDRLIASSAQRPELRLIEPGDPTESYLWLKVTADPTILGLPMPIDPLAGTRQLSPAALADIRTWIEAGAKQEE